MQKHGHYLNVYFNETGWSVWTEYFILSIDQMRPLTGQKIKLNRKCRAC